ncbi:hypothetical protein [Actinomadura litoris]|uniref:Vegetative cell wall protein gp1 n=1 Tax=Actinomadura litoris TaxID=2678616 RepID=A0A7K1L4N9_9ACTN|nr:hypothetical protein [Actinomadura litoris]MUN39404.1 hypothetical protein [Actinomadura litoris]
MNAFFGELAKKLAERWVALLAVPGLLFVAVAWAGVRLGWSHALDLALLRKEVIALGTSQGRLTVPAQLLFAVGLLLASCGIGLVVQALTTPVRAIWLGLWPRGLHGLRDRLATARAHRWNAHVETRQALQRDRPAADRTPAQQAAIDAAADRANRIALAPPARPTWMGDRVAAVEQVALNRYSLDLAFAWPRLWLVLPDPVRADLSAAHGQFAATVVTFAWAVPYAVLAVWWWPGAIVALAVALTGWTRARSTLAELTDLTEAALDLHGRTLATSLGTSPPESAGPLTPDEGRAITRQTRKGR